MQRSSAFTCPLTEVQTEARARWSINASQRRQQRACCAKLGRTPPSVCEPQDTCANRRDRVSSACEHRQRSSLFDVHFTRPSSRPSRLRSRSFALVPQTRLSSRVASSRRVRENPRVTHSTLASRSSRALSHTISRSLPCDPMSVKGSIPTNLRVAVPGPVAIAVSARRLRHPLASCGRVRRGHRCSDSPRSASPSPCLA
ncbi:hypothetical protein C8Q74DRAFT_1022993 [Fomes fomentarius]|nr:hypothetical protein C8Q74DRAFT_1022993 [Fomes fomentarius]